MKQAMIGQELFPMLQRVFGLPSNVRKCVLTMELNCVVIAEIEMIPLVDEDQMPAQRYHLVPIDKESEDDHD